MEGGGKEERKGEEAIAEDEQYNCCLFAVLMRREKKRAGLERREDGEGLRWWFGIFNSSPRWMVLGERA